MAKTKAAPKKQAKRGVDFKKIKRKLGRKLLPPNNATNTEIKSKAIVLPEQSLMSDKAGSAVSKKGLTLKELLQQSSHHNAKVRKDALLGLKDLLHRYPKELKLHRYTVIEKLRERINDDDKIVRETLYQLLKSVVLPSSKEDNQGPFISLMMVYIFNAMTHLVVDVRLMAFKFFDLVVQYYPLSFSLYAEKILQNYKNFLQKNQLYIEEKGKLKVVLSGLIQCLLLLPSNKSNVDVIGKDILCRKILHAYEPDVLKESTEVYIIMKKLKNLVPVLVNCFQDFLSLIRTVPTLDLQTFECMHSILTSIDLAVRFFINQVHKANLLSQNCGGDEVNLWNQIISSGLVKNLLDVFPLNPMKDLSAEDDDRYFTLNIVITEIFFHMSEWICPTRNLSEKFLSFIEYALQKICDGARPRKGVQRKEMLVLVKFIPELTLQLSGEWRDRLLQAFTEAFISCHPESDVKLVCLTAIEQMSISNHAKNKSLAQLYFSLIDKRDVADQDSSNSELLRHQIIWMRELPLLLILLGDRHASTSQVVLHLLIRLGQCSSRNSVLELEYDNLQYPLQGFYSTFHEDGNMSYGPFLKLPKDSQELAVCLLYYFSHLDSRLLKSITYCCLSPDLDGVVLFRFIEVLHSAYKAGHIKIADHTSFLLTLVSQFNIFFRCSQGNNYNASENDTKTSNFGTYKSMIKFVCSCLSQMGDSSLLFLILEKVILEQLSSRLPLDNACGILRVLAVLDSKPIKLSEQSITTLSNFLSAYLTNVALCISQDDDESVATSDKRTWQYYILPCYVLFDRNHNLINLVLNGLGSILSEATSSSEDYVYATVDTARRIDAIVSLLVIMHGDARIRELISSSKQEIDNISERICSLQSSDLPDEERSRIQHSFVRLTTLRGSFSRENPNHLRW